MGKWTPASAIRRGEGDTPCRPREGRRPTRSEVLKYLAARFGRRALDGVIAADEPARNTRPESRTVRFDDRGEGPQRDGFQKARALSQRSCRGAASWSRELLDHQASERGMVRGMGGWPNIASQGSGP